MYVVPSTVFLLFYYTLEFHNIMQSYQNTVLAVFKSMDSIEKSVDAGLDQSVNVFLANLKANQEVDVDAVRSQLNEQVKPLMPKIVAT